MKTKNAIVSSMTRITIVDYQEKHMRISFIKEEAENRSSPSPRRPNKNYVKMFFIHGGKNGRIVWLVRFSRLQT